jgi:hypothetical protein
MKCDNEVAPIFRGLAIQLAQQSKMGALFEEERVSLVAKISRARAGTFFASRYEIPLTEFD